MQSANDDIDGIICTGEPRQLAVILLFQSWSKSILASHHWWSQDFVTGWEFRVVAATWDSPRFFNTCFYILTPAYWSRENTGDMEIHPSIPFSMRFQKFPHWLCPSLPSPLQFEKESGQEESEVVQSCLTWHHELKPARLSSVLILQARILAWVAIFYYRDLPNPGMKLWSPMSQAGSYSCAPPGKQKVEKFWKFSIYA